MKYLKQFILNFWVHNLQQIRIAVFKKLSTNQINGKPNIIQPALFLGQGQINFSKNVQIGYYPSPFFYSTNAHFEARTKNSRITIGEKVYFNNNFVAIAEKEITLGNNILIGTNVEIYDSDFHNIDPALRFGGHEYEKAEVKIQDNVWIGSNVKILKGVTIGENSVIASGAIVTKSIPENVLAGGIPAKILKKIGNES
ncbi:DapH/DapD/GlmU-related protein [Marinilabilia salmonicolor]|uniref:DapH/DapD/GlmU-related protein n=1 Tax=Marinilabilia salmonicolor TaxID=989 RepID=UPI00029A307D|nr:DapH/DapD/GlmU-related protein [Marinilabilia salmonicolor]